MESNQLNVNILNFKSLIFLHLDYSDRNLCRQNRKIESSNRKVEILRR